MSGVLLMVSASRRRACGRTAESRERVGSLTHVSSTTKHSMVQGVPKISGVKVSRKPRKFTESSEEPTRSRRDCHRSSEGFQSYQGRPGGSKTLELRGGSSSRSDLGTLQDDEIANTLHQGCSQPHACSQAHGMPTRPCAQRPHTYPELGPSSRETTISTSLGGRSRRHLPRRATGSSSSWRIRRTRRTAARVRACPRS